MKQSVIAAAAALALVTFTNSPVAAQNQTGTVVYQQDGVISTRSNNSLSNYMTTADGCSYRRTQAPGYPPQWILILNPYHIGQPNAHRGCRGRL